MGLAVVLIFLPIIIGTKLLSDTIAFRMLLKKKMVRAVPELEQPKNKEDAFRMLKSLQGRKHVVITSVCIMHKDKIDTFLSKSYVTFYKMSNDEINEYIETNEPMDKAGAYAIQGKAAKYIRSINGDYYTIVGLPIGKVIKSLKKLKALS